MTDDINAEMAALATAAVCAGIMRTTGEIVTRSRLMAAARERLSAEQVQQIHAAALAMSAAAEALCDATRAAGGEA